MIFTHESSVKLLFSSLKLKKNLFNICTLFVTKIFLILEEFTRNPLGLFTVVDSSQFKIRFNQITYL